jgi:hypothetical protein
MWLLGACESIKTFFSSFISHFYIFIVFERFLSSFVGGGERESEEDKPKKEMLAKTKFYTTVNLHKFKEEVMEGNRSL